MLDFVSESQLASFHNQTLGPPAHHYGSKACIPREHFANWCAWGIVPSAHIAKVFFWTSNEKKKKKDFSKT